ncbi:hypothetical protein C8R43DRAFT_133916 [Mycena crocata]|nr:hypothetical protein C8R43DRAFT_133916 [Mycena crocata]
MAPAPLQDTLQSLQPPPISPRFRPYASSVHHVAKGRYITSNDPRGYIPVYEYPLNSQWIMMDIDDGYILWTGIWKALGNSKADIVKMIDSQPDLAGVIRRVRGGYLKIQGTWMPFEVAERLARRVAWTIRDDLIPLFGPNFPSTCLAPDQPGYGQVVASSSGRRRARRNPQPQPALAPTPNPHVRGSWPRNPHPQPHPNAHPPAPWPSNAHPSHPSHPPHPHLHPHGIPLHQPSPFAPIPLTAAMQYAMATSPIYPVELAPQPGSGPGQYASSPQHERLNNSSMAMDRLTPSSSRDLDRMNAQAHSRHRYAPYPQAGSSSMSATNLHAALQRRLSSSSHGSLASSSSRGSLSLEMPALSINDGAPSPARPSDANNPLITLPAIQPPKGQADGGSSLYALPPISALEDLRGVDAHWQDPTAVLRRLQADDDVHDADTKEEEHQRRIPRSLSVPAARIPSHSHAETLSVHRRSLGQIPLNNNCNNKTGFPKLSLSVPSASDAGSSRSGSSTCDPSPVSPATPRSATRSPHTRALVPLAVLKEQSRLAAPYAFPAVAFAHNDWLRGDAGRGGSGGGVGIETSACRYSCMDVDDRGAAEGVPVPMGAW